MRPHLAVPFLAVVLLAVSGCDLVSDPDGPQPEDFEVQADSSEVRAADDDKANAAVDVRMRQDVASPLSTARSGMTLSITPPR